MHHPVFMTRQPKLKCWMRRDGLELPTAGFVFNRSNINLENELEILQSYVILEQGSQIALNLTTQML